MLKRLTEALANRVIVSDFFTAFKIIITIQTIETLRKFEFKFIITLIIYGIIEFLNAYNDRRY